MPMTLVTSRMKNSMMPTTWIATLVTSKPMSTGSNPKIPGLPKAEHHRIHVLPSFLQKGTPLNHTCPASNGIACNLRHVQLGIKAIILGLCKDPGKCIVNLHKISAFDFLQANLHENLLDKIKDPVKIPPDPDKDQADTGPQLDEDTSTVLLAFLSKQESTTHPGHLANILSTSKNKNAKGARFMTKPDASAPKDDEVIINGKKYHQVQTHQIY